ncbi:hypothetical protein Pst134EA_032177 [Puccinia striiformis f. sp. tritici]|nr:uncharacterized protein Pst134EA_032177 [Puccinia striiformis f. sp. tritici]KAH9441842.1 hypothetical protein Pst134EA_032177 [Puccinia striiformis f. sp. tritici]KAI9617103.1 hypothetical protein KEM48_004960 [Puccinia striiformis f. sp. tritici PST-130]KNE94036.1 hypothetical protein, variant [Puccinia striiformis f. sp. tritici PST-78]
MPALTAPYAHPPAHGAGWASLNTKPTFSRSASSCSASMLTACPPMTPFPGHSRSKKSRFERITKPLSSPISRLKKSPSSISQQHAIIVGTPSPRVAVRGILCKSSSLINLSTPTAPVVLGGSPMALVVKATLKQPSPPSSESAQPIAKKVRFSGPLAPDGMVPQRCGLMSVCGQKGDSGAYLVQAQASSPELGPPVEPVIETIFLTYSRSAYDRSPITVDRELNKSLALPPRTEDDNSCNGRWLADVDCSASTERLPMETRIKTFPTELGDQLEARLLIPLTSAFSTSDHNAHQIFVAADSPASVDWHGRPELFGHSWHSEDSLSETASSSASSQEPATPAIAELFPHRPSLDTLLAPSAVPNGTVENHLCSSSLSVENLAHHAFSDLRLHETELTSDSSIACLPIDTDPLCGFGNWTRAQVFGSCDALDGF